MRSPGVVSEELQIGDRSLARVLEDLVTAWTVRYAVPVEVWALPAREVPAMAAHAVIEVVREGLAACSRHGRVQHVGLAITVGRDAVRITISDDGDGIPTSVERAAEAASRAGGTLRVNDVAGEGSTLSAAIPLR